MTTKRKTTKAKRKTTKTTKYHRLTDKQLVAVIRKWQKRFTSLAKTPEWKTTQGWTPRQQRTCLARELKVVATVLRYKILTKIDNKIYELKTQEAKRRGVSINSPVVNSAVVKRLKAKRAQVVKCKGYPTLATVCAAIKFGAYKAPTSRTGVTRTTRTVGKTATGGTYYRTTTATAINTKYKKQTASLKREIQRLKQRNSSMRSQVAKFRKEVAKLQRHYGSINSTTKRGVSPSLRLVSNKVGQDVSNIVRFSNALSNAITKRRFAS